MSGVGWRACAVVVGHSHNNVVTTLSCAQQLPLSWRFAGEKLIGN